MKEVAVNLRVDLPKDVRCLRHVELEATARSHNLRRNLILGEELLVHTIIVLLAEDDHNYLGMAEHTLRSIHHIRKELGLDLDIVILVLQLDKVRLLDANLEQLARLAERVVDAVGDLEVGALTRT